MQNFAYKEAWRILKMFWNLRSYILQIHSLESDQAGWYL